jgi:hypothetical protein
LPARNEPLGGPPLSVNRDASQAVAVVRRMRLVAVQTEAVLNALRMRYKAVFAAHQSCVRALTEANMSGAAATPELLTNETKIRQELAEARAALLAAMTEAGQPKV